MQTLSSYQKGAIVRKAKRHDEFLEQKMIFQWAEAMAYKIPELQFMHCSLNGSVKLTYPQMMRAKLSGQKSGVPDIFLPVTNSQYAGLFIELKVRPQSETKPRLSDNQKAFIEHLNSQGYLAIVCFGADFAIQVIKAYLDDLDMSRFIEESLSHYATRRKRTKG